ncbi:MAG TPA: hypothetical protein VLZ72_02410 [Flavobacterium sp.]|nr:hypothetical protein [Flavobacterium sp.]
MNHIVSLLSISIPSGILLFIGGKWLFYKVVRKKGIALLEKIYFADDQKLKGEVLNKLKKITNHQYTDLQLTDYFLKIKGLQNFNKDGNTNIWIRLYLKQKTAIKLDYFEQYNFFKAFKDFPSKAKSLRKKKRKSTKVNRPQEAVESNI